MICKILPIQEKFYKETGSSDYMIDIKTVEDILSLDAACRSTDETYDCLIIRGTTIGILRKGEFLNG